jgi:hypothetical protein
MKLSSPARNSKLATASLADTQMTEKTNAIQFPSSLAKKLTTDNYS